MHACCAVTIGVIWGIEKSWRITVTYEWVEWVDEANGTSIQPRIETIFDFPLLLLSFLFAAITAFSHGVQAMCLVEEQPNQIRWWEYSMSATVMIWLIAALSGLSSIFSFIWLAALTWITMFLGWVSETMYWQCSVGKPTSFICWLRGMRIRVIVMAWTAQVSVWIPIIWTFFVSVERSDAPAVIKAINPTLFVFFCFGFGLLHVLPGLSWGAREMGYIVLSFASKFLLNAFIVAGLYMRTRENVSVA